MCSQKCVFLYIITSWLWARRFCIIVSPALPYWQQRSSNLKRSIYYVPGLFNWQNFVINVFKYNVSCTHGKISIRIKIIINFIIRFHRRPIELQRSTAQAGRQKKFRHPTRPTEDIKNWRKATGTNTTNWMGRRWNMKIKVIAILASKIYVHLLIMAIWWQ